MRFMASTQTTTGTTSVLKVPSGDVIYDAIMSKIDKDLVTVNLPKLAEKYKGESAGERVKRFKRYQKAYAKYEQAYAEWIGKLHAAVEKYRRKALGRAEVKDRTKEADILAGLESSFDTAK